MHFSSFVDVECGQSAPHFESFAPPSSGASRQLTTGAKHVAAPGAALAGPGAALAGPEVMITGMAARSIELPRPLAGGLGVRPRGLGVRRPKLAMLPPLSARLISSCCCWRAASWIAFSLFAALLTSSADLGRAGIGGIRSAISTGVSKVCLAAASGVAISVDAISVTTSPIAGGAAVGAADWAAGGAASAAGGAAPSITAGVAE